MKKNPPNIIHNVKKKFHHLLFIYFYFLYILKMLSKEKRELKKTLLEAQKIAIQEVKDIQVEAEKIAIQGVKDIQSEVQKIATQGVRDIYKITLDAMNKSMKEIM